MWGVLKSAAAAGLSEITAKVDEITTQSLASATQFLEKIDGAVEGEGEDNEPESEGHHGHDADEATAMEQVPLEKVASSNNPKISAVVEEEDGSNAWDSDINIADDEEEVNATGDNTEKATNGLHSDAAAGTKHTVEQTAEDDKGQAPVETVDYSSLLLRERDETISNMKREIHKLNQKMHGMEEVAMAMQAKCDQKTTELLAAQKELSTLQSSSTKLTTERDALRVKVDDLESEVWDLQLKLDKSNESATSTIDVETLQTQVIALKELNDKMSEELEVLKASNGHITSELSAALSEMNKTVSDLEAANSRNCELEAQVGALTESYRLLEEGKAEFVSQLRHVSDEINQKEAKISASTDELLRAREQSSSTGAAASEQTEQLRQALSASEFECRRLTGLVDESNKHLHDLESISSERSKECEKLTAQLEESRQRISLLEATETAEMTNKYELIAALEAANQRIAAFEKQNEIARLKGKLDEVKAMKVSCVRLVFGSYVMFSVVLHRSR
jgi:chromosome segregation ATPase